jgi:hypothetical protein
MKPDVCSKMFGNLYDNKIIFHERITVFCEFIECRVVDGIADEFSGGLVDGFISLELKMIEPVLKIRPIFQNIYEKWKVKNISVGTNNPNNINLDLQEIGGAYCPFHIWTNYDLVKKISELKKQGKTEEIPGILWW